MEMKTKVSAAAGEQGVVIYREFDLPLHLLFKAYADPEIVAQWMGTRVLKLESRKHGSYRFETTNAQGQVVFSANGVIHEFITDKKITRTFEMENAPFGVQLEICTFEALTPETSRLDMRVIYETPALRDQLMKLPFAQGLNMAHNRIEETIKKLK